VRRLFWLAFGLGAGATGAVMASRWTRKQAARAKPQTLVREAKGGLLEFSKLVSESIEEGKRAMDDRARELRGVVGDAGTSSDRDDDPTSTAA
jgi:hypothetical protein